jgi:hypothetical protein
VWRDTSRDPPVREAWIRVSRLERQWTILMKDRRKPQLWS